jgi:hypothetical protein
MRQFWATAGEAQSPDGELPKGKIYDPATGKVVDLADHTRKVGDGQAFSDELANTQSGRGRSFQGR